MMESDAWGMTAPLGSLRVPAMRPVVAAKLSAARSSEGRSSREIERTGTPTLTAGRAGVEVRGGQLWDRCGYISGQ